MASNAAVSNTRAPFVFCLGLNLMGWAVLAALVYQAGFYSIFLIQKSRDQFEASFAECVVTERALAVAKGEPLFPANLREWPYLVCIYGPLTYYTVGIPVRMIGLPQERFDQARRVYLTGRCVSLLSAAAVVALLWTLGGRLGLTGIWRLLPPLLFFSARLVILAGYTYRPDFPLVALCIAAWFTALEENEKPDSLDWFFPVTSAVCMTLAFYFKQTALISAGTLLIWLLVARRFRHATAYAAAFAFLTITAGIVLYVTTQGAWWANNFGGLRSPIYWPAPYKILIKMRVLDALPLIGGALVCVGILRIEERARPLKWAFAFSFAASELFMLRLGSNTYYLLEPYCWGTLLTAIAIHNLYTRFARAGQPVRLPHPVWILILVAAFCCYGYRTRRLHSERADLRAPAPWVLKNANAVRALGQIRGQALVSEGYAWWFTQSPPTMMDALVYSARVRGGGLSPDALVGKVLRRDFEWIVLNWEAGKNPYGYQDLPILPPVVIDAILGDYRFDSYQAPYYFYRPR